jgi:hypothetical protein
VAGKKKMMKWVKLLSWAGEQYSLLESSEDSFYVKFWGTVKPDFTNGNYHVVAYTPDRELKTIQETITSLEEAQEAIEKFLFDTGTLKEGDEIEYESN